MFSNLTPNLAVFGNLIVFSTCTCFHSVSFNPTRSELPIPPSCVEYGNSSVQFTTSSLASNSNRFMLATESTPLEDTLA